PHLFDDVIAGLRLETGDWRGAPSSAHHRLVIDHSFEQRRVERETGRARFDNEPHVYDHHTACSAGLGQAADVLDDVLLASVLWRARGGEGAPFHHHVVMHVLNDERAARWVERKTALGAGTLRCRRRRIDRGRRAGGLSLPHERLDAWAYLRAQLIERMGGAHEKRAPISLAPVQIGD